MSLGPGHSPLSTVPWQRLILKLFLLASGKILVISKNVGLLGFFQLSSELTPPCLLTEGAARAGSGPNVPTGTQSHLPSKRIRPS